MLLSNNEVSKDDRVSRILDAALEVFAQSSFEDATMGEVARVARVSKRDLYACFANKQVLLNAIVSCEMQRLEKTFRVRMQTCGQTLSLAAKLEGIGKALVFEILSPRMRVVRRLVVSESIKQPVLGDIYYAGGVEERCRLIAKVLANHHGGHSITDAAVTDKAAHRYLASVAYLPAAMTEIGLEDRWSDEAIEAHVAGATRMFLRAHPSLAGTPVAAWKEDPSKWD